MPAKRQNVGGGMCREAHKKIRRGHLKREPRIVGNGGQTEIRE